jgi:hypothetical protein
VKMLITLDLVAMTALRKELTRLSTAGGVLLKEQASVDYQKTQDFMAILLKVNDMARTLIPQPAMEGVAFKVTLTANATDGLPTAIKMRTEFSGRPDFLLEASLPEGAPSRGLCEDFVLRGIAAAYPAFNIADVNQDGIVDALDLNIVVSHWQEGTVDPANTLVLIPESTS